MHECQRQRITKETPSNPYLALSDAWKVLFLFTTPEAMVEEETLGRFLQKIVRPPNCALKRRLDGLCICCKASLLNCERAAVEKYRGLVAAWLRMQTLKFKPLKVAKKSNSLNFFNAAQGVLAAFATLGLPWFEAK